MIHKLHKAGAYISAFSWWIVLFVSVAQHAQASNAQTANAQPSNLHALNRRNQIASARSEQLRLVGGGDVIFHGALLVQAMSQKHGFESLWDNVLPVLRQADLVYANLEGPAAENVGPNGRHQQARSEAYDPAEGIYSVGTEGRSYTFNFHPDSVRALQKAGIGVVSLANNHSFDRGLLGVDRTIELLKAIGLPSFGLLHRDGSRGSFRTVVERNGIRVGFVGCTYGANIVPSGGAQVIPFCFQQSRPNPIVLEQIRMAKSESDVVVFTPHWGIEYSDRPDAASRQLAQAALSAGARVILGHHPHVLQPIEVSMAGGEMQSMVAYSLGNFVTNQHPYDLRDTVKDQARFPQRVGALIALSFQRRGYEIIISKPKFVPTYMTTRADGPKGLRTVVPAYTELFLTPAPAHRSLQASIRRARAVFDRLIPEEYRARWDELNQLF